MIHQRTLAATCVLLAACASSTTNARDHNGAGVDEAFAERSPISQGRTAGALAGSDLPARRRALRKLRRQAAALTTGKREAERKKFANEVLDMLEKQQGFAATVRCDLLRLLGLVIDDETTVTRLSAWLESKVTAEAALFALERIPTGAAEQMLARYLERDSALPRSAYARALAQRGSGSATAQLLELAANANPEANRAARAALARSGDVRARKLLERALTTGTPGAAEDWLDYLEALDPPLTRDARIKEYERLLEVDSVPVRLAAHLALARLDPNASSKRALAALADSSAAVREAGRQILTQCKDPATDARLVTELGKAKPELAADLLGVLCARSSEAALAEVKKALTAESPVLRIAAMELSTRFTDPSIAATLTAALGDGDAGVRDAAGAALGPRIAFLVADGDSDGARSLLHRILAQCQDEQVVVTALGQLAKVADESSLAVVAPLRAAHADEVRRVYVAVASDLADDDEPRAKALLVEVVENTKDRSLRRKARQALERLGVDTSGFARRRGVLRDWHVLGPYSKATAGDFAKHPFGKDLAGPITVGDRKLDWVARKTDDDDGIIDLTFLKPNTDVTAFATCELVCQRPRKVVLHVGSDDGVAVWVNGKLVHENFVARGIEPDQDRVTADLVAGRNRILLRISQAGGGFAFCVRLTDPSGKPLDPTKL